MDTYFISTQNASHVASKILERQDQYPGLKTTKLVSKEGEFHFPDNEVYVKLEGINKLSKERVFVLHSGIPHPNAGLMFLENVLSVLKEPRTGTRESDEPRLIEPPSSVSVFFLYFPYGKQDQVFRTGEANSAKNIIEKLFNFYGVHRVYGIDLHFYREDWEKEENRKLEWARPYFESGRIVNVSALDLLKNAARADLLNATQKESGVEDPYWITLDGGGSERFDLPGFDKDRRGVYHVNIKDLDDILESRGERPIGIVDDMVQTGRTLMGGIAILDEKRITDYCTLITHGVIRETIEGISKDHRLYLSNSIDNGIYSNVDISDLVARTMLDSA